MTSNQALEIYCDGGSRGNPGPAACAFIVKDKIGKTVHQQGKYLGVATNNLAEYAAVLSAVEWVAKNSPQSSLSFYLDSLLVVNQLTGKFKIKDQNLKTENLKIKNLISDFKLVIEKVVYIPRSQNYPADALVNSTLDSRTTVNFSR